MLNPAIIYKLYKDLFYKVSLYTHVFTLKTNSIHKMQIIYLRFKLLISFSYV